MMIPYGHQSIDEDDIAAVVDVLRSDRLTQGPMVAAFEEALAAKAGAAHAVAFANGTLALQAAYFAIGLQPGDEFITTPLTFVATANAGMWLGGSPVFVDVDPETGNMDPSRLAAAITPRTRAIVPVDYAGHPADITAIRAIAQRHGIPVIEDACHAFGAAVGGAPVGSLADLTVFSFHPVKPITTGEGGAVVTNDSAYADRLRLFRSHGITRDQLERPSEGPWYYEMQVLGLNARITDIQCALGLSQLRKLDRFLHARSRIAARYAEMLRGVDGLRLPSELPGIQSGWHLYPVRLQDAFVDRRAEIVQKLHTAGIGVQVHYIPVHLHPFYMRRGHARGDYPNAEAFYAAEISLPIYPGLTDTQIETVVQAVKEALAT
ncbi:MAG: hypothetical protein RL141_904 [Candidatus Parcubacteria bacterium]|jgi:UDP-4-amino-4,6-dideoxy-N-acetyl-beta-L-altrosamine transaminase